MSQMMRYKGYTAMITECPLGIELNIFKEYVGKSSIDSSPIESIFKHYFPKTSSEALGVSIAFIDGIHYGMSIVNY